MAKQLIRKTITFLAVFLIPMAFAIIPTFDRYDSEFQQIASHTKQANDTQWVAMEGRNASGDYGEIYEK